MRNTIRLMLLMIALHLTLYGCGPSRSPTAIHQSPPQTSVLAMVTITSPTTTLLPEGEINIVTSVTDSGPGTLRQALLDAQPNDIITFDHHL